MTELNECDRHTKGLLCHRLSPALLIRINLAWLKMQMAQRHWRSLHVFITFNWFNYMENEMVGCAITCPPHPHPPVSCDREMTILSCQEDKVMRLAALLRALSLFPSLPFGGCRCVSSKWVFFRVFFSVFIVIARNILVWVSEAPTLLCGPGASLKFKEFPPTVHHFRLALYMVSARGCVGGMCSDYSCCCFSSLNKHTSRDTDTEGGSEVLADRFN